MIKTETNSTYNFDRPKLLLFKFLAHQIHPFAYAVNTFLRPALDDCFGLMSNNPQDTFNVLLSLSQTFTRFAPETELIYDDIQQFAIKLKDTIDKCFTCLDPDTVQQSSQLLETTHESLLKIIRQQSTENTTYTNMYKNMSAVLTNLEKINSLPAELQTVSNHTTVPTMNSTQNRINPLTSQLKTLSINNPSYFNEYEVVDTSVQSLKQTPTINNVASFPPRQTPSLFTSTIGKSSVNSTNGYYSSSLLNEAIRNDPLKTNEHLISQKRDTPSSIVSNEETIRSNTTLEQRTSSIHSGGDDETNSRKFQFSARFIPDQKMNSIASEPTIHIDRVKIQVHPHVTDEFMQEFGNKRNRPQLRGELSMTFGIPQSGPQSSCLPIGLGLSYDELTLLSCDVHRNAQNVRLFDVQTGQLKQTINSTQVMKFHRPSAVMSNARENIFIVEKDAIYITEANGRHIQTLTHRSIKQLYGIGLFRDRYVLTMDSKSLGGQSSEQCRLLLFDPNNQQLVFEQNISINQQIDNQLRQQYINNIQGSILPESNSKPRFLAVHNDEIYIADLGRSLIYGTQLRNQFDFTPTTVFGGYGRSNGEFHEPSGLYIDSGGNIISADSKNDRIQLFSSDGEFKAVFRLDERIRRPSGICSNRAGTQFYVSCYLAGCVRGYNIRY